MIRLLSTQTGKEVSFELSTEPGDQVFVAGTFNNWDSTTNRLKDNPDSGHFKTVLHVPPGTHEYKFVVNGVWTVDPKCMDWIANEYGSLNSVLRV